MGRSKRSEGELDQLDKLKHENKKLKRQVQQLRKVIDRVDLDRYENLKDILEEHEHEEKMALVATPTDPAWKCYDCEAGILRLKVIDKPSGAIYNRVCDGCKKRTKFQKWTKDVK